MKDKPEEFKAHLRILCLNLDFGFSIRRHVKVRSEFLASQLVRRELQGVPVGLKVAAQRFCMYNCFHLHE